MALPHFVFQKERKLQTLLNDISLSRFTKIIVFENNFDWNGIMMQRPQQMALHFPENVLFFYHSSQITTYQKIKDNLYLINLNVFRELLQEKLVHISSCYLMLYSTDYVPIKRIDDYLAHHFQIIYEYVDDLSEELCGNAYEKLLTNYRYLVSLPNVYIDVTATKLLENIKKDNPSAKVKLITNGCDYEHFSKKKLAIPDDMKNILKKKNPIIGYYGALASWFDYSLINALAKTGKYEIVLIGQKYDKSFDHQSLESVHIHYLGKKEYKELPNYLQTFDVCMIPFLVNDITLSTSPVKLFEYMSGGKPIVTTDLPECHKYQSVLVSSSKDTFLENIDKALKLKDDVVYLELLKKEALANTWSEKCISLLQMLDER